MFLAFPLDFQKDIYIRAVVAPYGRLLEWYRDANKSRILVFFCSALIEYLRV
jgi:hypothetical protein